jgi:hypothetical protein
VRARPGENEVSNTERHPETGFGSSSFHTNNFGLTHERANCAEIRAVVGDRELAIDEVSRDQWSPEDTIEAPAVEVFRGRFDSTGEANAPVKWKTSMFAPLNDLHCLPKFRRASRQLVAGRIRRHRGISLASH